MTKRIKINKQEYNVQLHEFNKIKHLEYNNLQLLTDVDYVERVVGLLRDLRESIFDDKPCCFLNMDIEDYNKYGQFIIKNLSKYFTGITETIDYSQGFFYSTNSISPKSHKCDCLLLKYKYDEFLDTHVILEWKDMNMYLYISVDYYSKFKEIYKFNIYEENSKTFLIWDNLLHLVIMVKDAGDDFKNVLEENIPFVDRLTVLDTGSTDNTISIVEEILKTKIRGNIHREPFINFRDSRNRALDLAGDICKYTLMLDDTYVLKGNIRSFLKEIRGDQFSDSFSLYIQSDDVQYVSNRLVKTFTKLRYKFMIHEVITEENNVSVIIPLNKAHIFDKRSDYMENRTMNRKQSDLDLLFKSVEEEPFNPRHIYYIAQTYNCMEKKEEAYKFFLHRSFHYKEGFFQEKIDSLFEAGRIAQFYLNKPWKEVEFLYEKAYELDNTRPDTRYFIGIHWYLQNDMYTAYQYFKKSFELGYPINSQYSLKPTLTYFYTPKFLIPLCYQYGDYKTGKEACELFLKNNKPNTYISKDYCSEDLYNQQISWYQIFNLLLHLPPYTIPKPFTRDKPILCFVADGNFHTWTGSDILTKGIGGSETYIIEMSRHIQKLNEFTVLVFCRCSKEEIFEGVQYLDISKYLSFIRQYEIHTCVISRFSEYLPATYESYVENIHLVVHDLITSGNVIPIKPKLKNIFCLSEWHKEYFDNYFSELSNITIPLHYGIDIDKFKNFNPNKKLKNSFIYSSFANRGLLPLLELWPKIKKNIPDATLHIYSDINHEWTNSVALEQMNKIRESLRLYKDGIYYYGWVSKDILYQGWEKCEYWLYPCIFKETFCLTALEAALSKTLAITNNLAALENTVGDRGILIDKLENDNYQSPMSEKLKDSILEKILWITKNTKVKEELIQKNYEWALTHSWKNQSHKFLNYLKNI